MIAKVTSACNADRNICTGTLFQVDHNTKRCNVCGRVVTAAPAPSKIGVVGIVMSLVMLLTVWGCTTTPPSVPVITTAPIVSQAPVVSSVPQPNNMPPITVTNFVPVTNFVLVTNWTAQPTVVNTNQISRIVYDVQTAGGIVGTVNPVAGMATSTAAGLLGTLLFSLSAGYAAYKNQGTKNILSAVIAGVEGAAGPNGTDTTPVTVAAVKASIQSQAIKNGSQPALNAAVQKQTA